MRVLHVTNLCPQDQEPALGVFVKNQIDSLAEVGVENEICVISVHPSKVGYLFEIWSFWRHFRKDHYDLIHAHYGTSALVARWQWKAPLVVSYCGSDILRGAFGTWSQRCFRAGANFLFRWLSLTVSRVIVKSEEMRKSLPRQAGVFVIPNGVDFKRFVPLDREACRRQLDLDPKKHYILFGGDRKILRKNFSLAQRSVETLSYLGVEAELLTVSGLPQDKYVLYLNASNVLLLTSRLEGSPNVVKEALACNVPVIATDVGDVSTLLEGCPRCFVVPFDSVHIAKRFAEILEHDERPETRERIAHLDQRLVAQIILRVYEDILGPKRLSP